MKLTLCFLADIQPEIFFSLLEKPNSVLPFKFILTEYIEQISQWLIRATISGKTSRTSFPWRSEIKLVKMLPWLLINYPLKRRLFISYFLVKWKFFGNRFCLHRAVPRIFCLRGQTPQTFTGISRIQTGFLVKHYVRKKKFSWRGQLPPPLPPPRYVRSWYTYYFHFEEWSVTWCSLYWKCYGCCIWREKNMK